MDEKPRTNIGQSLIENFSLEQQRFMEAQLKFKSGFLAYGVVAANLLTSMYYILPAARHIAKGEEASEKFVNELDEFRRACLQYSKRKGYDNIRDNDNYFNEKDFIEVDNRFDRIIRKFYKIMFDTGFSP